MVLFHTVEKYYIFSEGQLIDSSSGVVYTVKGLDPLTDYTFSIQAVDFGGNTFLAQYHSPDLWPMLVKKYNIGCLLISFTHNDQDRLNLLKRTCRENNLILKRFTISVTDIDLEL